MRTLLTICLLLCAASLWPIRASTYYVDAVKGDDHNSGTSPDAAWRTLGRVNAASFSPGDTVLLHRGCVWREQLNFPSSGDSAAPSTPRRPRA